MITIFSPPSQPLNLIIKKRKGRPSKRKKRRENGPPFFFFHYYYRHDYYLCLVFLFFFLFLSCFGAALPCENRTTTAGGFRVCPCPVRAGHNFPIKQKQQEQKKRKITKQAHHFIGYCVDESVSRVLAHNQTMYTHTHAGRGTQTGKHCVSVSAKS